MVLVIDNYDSFTYNLVQYVGEMGEALTVVRNDRITVPEIRKLNPRAIILSPGPCRPSDAGATVEVVRQLHKEYPILGVCLGHQAIGEALGGRVVKAEQIFHGKTSLVHHTGHEIFADIPSPFTAARYHSLIVEKVTLPLCLEVTAWTPEGVIMGLRHREHPTFGVQFHPESIATEHGKQILRNFLSTN
ncbi:MAG: aminodeoxychorismate/anthranilate synthase component II [Ignavibacteriales bacterium]|nr:aminodeoxychorismate/anthranilate synthase component II [Ignavibacteriales bacterium]